MYKLNFTFFENLVNYIGKHPMPDIPKTNTTKTITFAFPSMKTKFTGKETISELLRFPVESF